MMADSTSASSGVITSSRSWSVLDGAICSSGISSPVAGSRYWISEWWVSSVSSSMRIPVCRSTSTIAQVQNPRCSAKVRSTRVALPGCSAQTRPVVCAVITQRRQVTPCAVNSVPGAAAEAACSAAAVRSRSFSTQAIRLGSAGSRSRVRWSIRDLRWERSFLWETSLAVTGQRTAHGAHRAGSSSAHSARSR